ncbi:2491_t:CDS:2 [Entrophospora sp. SA101]|nr:2491_t:CDS:2 [Entrophospora sp. SA101]
MKRCRLHFEDPAYYISYDPDKSDIRIYSIISEINSKNPKYFGTKNWISPTALSKIILVKTTSSARFSKNTPTNLIKKHITISTY